MSSFFIAFSWHTCIGMWTTDVQPSTCMYELTLRTLLFCRCSFTRFIGTWTFVHLYKWGVAWVSLAQRSSCSVAAAFAFAESHVFLQITFFFAVHVLQQIILRYLRLVHSILWCLTELAEYSGRLLIYNTDSIFWDAAGNIREATR